VIENVVSIPGLIKQCNLPQDIDIFSILKNMDLEICNYGTVKGVVNPYYDYNAEQNAYHKALFDDETDFYQHLAAL